MKGFLTVLALTGAAVVAAACLAGCGAEKTGDTTEPTAEQAPAEQLPEGLTAEQAARVVAKVGEREITVADVTRQINRLSPYIRRRWASPEKRKEFLEKLIRVELLSQEAERLGLDKDAEVQRTVKQVMIRLMIKNDLEKNLLPATIEEKELRAEYEANLDKYHRPPQMRVSQIVVKDEKQAQTLLAELVEKAKDTRLFRDKAKALSIDEATKDRGGDVGYVSAPGKRRDDEPELPAAVVEAVWALETVGDFAPAPIKTDAGYHVVKLTNKKPEMNRSFESVKRLIENRMLRDKRRQVMDEFVNGLRAKAKVELFPDNLAEIRVEEPAEHGHSHGSPLSGDIPGPPIKPAAAASPADDNS